MGAVPKFPGLGDRLAGRLRARGYVKGERLDVLRFALDFRYNPASVYAWLKGATPLFAVLERLAKDLDCELGWLLLGDERLSPERGPRVLSRVTKKGRYAKPISGGSGAAGPLPLPSLADVLMLIRRLFGWDAARPYAALAWARNGRTLQLAAGAA